MAFDIEGARKAGYSDDEIADYLAGQQKFDIKGARSAGYGSQDIIGFLSKKSQPVVAEFPSFEGMAAPEEIGRAHV